MSSAYQIFVDDEAIDVLMTLRSKDKHEIRSFIRSLAEDPFQEGDFPETDREGRTIFTKLIGAYAVGYYPDHAVKEVKVFEIIRADS
ncbi:hypothetical protein [Cerasicoccus fimbriatus]|uniref:hypothetical protein n=1 Tax=Cerasicoccus fimbriatus TaxID=3014554 RepID=UPI0022B33593|nr:hypothetical protein [Cerasicoccus sp. TK19100]